jgi:aryl-alcohol dehydrogenase-like predicted oxidoreductase
VRHRRIGSADLAASEVGLAVWSLVAGEGARSDEDAAALLAAALDLGMAYFEATDSDDHGRAEELLGQALRGHRDEVTVATTFGYDTTPRPWDPTPQAPRHDWSAVFAGRALDRSLQRLRLEPIDLWLLHHPGMDAIEFDELQLLHPAVDRADPLRGAARPGGAGARGRGRAPESVGWPSNLPGQQCRGGTWPPTADRGRLCDPLAPRLDAAARARLEFLERDRGRTLDQALLRFALADPAVATALPEVRDRDQLAELAGAADLDPLTPEDLDRIAELHARGGL